MNEREVKEIRRRLNPEKSNISCIRGCFVNQSKEIVTQFDQLMATTPEDEASAIMAVIKKTLSGTLGTNLIDVEFGLNNEDNNDRHSLMMALKNSNLRDDEAVNEFFYRVSQSVDIEGEFIILLASDDYDVFSYTADGKRSEESENIFSYIICCVCPVKPLKQALSFQFADHAFHKIASNTILCPPQLGVMFPSFDQRCENIYKALYYTHDIANSHTMFTNMIFKAQVPAPALIQKENFEGCLGETIGNDLDFDAIKSIHETVEKIVEINKDNKNEEPIEIDCDTIKDALSQSGVDDRKIEAFSQKYEEDFGKDKSFKPQNIVDTKKFEVATPDVTIKVNPKRKDLISTQIINGKKYILIRADEGVEVNGVDVHIN